MLIGADAVAAVPVHRRAAEREIDGRHRAAPVDQTADAGKAMRIVGRDQLPFRIGARRPAATEDAAAQHHAECGKTRLGRGYVHVRVVRVQDVEDGIGAAGLVEDVLQRAGVDGPRIAGDVTGCAAPAVAALGLKEFAGQFDRAVSAEGRGLASGVLLGVVVRQRQLQALRRRCRTDQHQCGDHRDRRGKGRSTAAGVRRQPDRSFHRSLRVRRPAGPCPPSPRTLRTDGRLLTGHRSSPLFPRARRATLASGPRCRGRRLQVALRPPCCRPSRERRPRAGPFHRWPSRRLRTPGCGPR